MKRAIIVAMLFVSTVFSEKVVDEFDNSTYYTTKYTTVLRDIRVFSKMQIVKYSDDEIYINVKFVPYGASVFAIERNYPMRIMLNNGVILTVLADEYVISCLGCGRDGNIASRSNGIKVRYRITMEQLKQLSNHSVKKIRVYGSEGYFDEKVGDRYKYRLRDMAREILE